MHISHTLGRYLSVVGNMASPLTLRNQSSVSTKEILLGHVVSEEGISIDPERVESIKNIRPPTNKKSLQSFFGKINFIRWFIPNFVEKVKPMNALLRKDVTFKWDNDSLKSFEDIKEAITTALSWLALITLVTL
jgi:hypothetical protein